MPNDHALHLDPVWRERANHILDAELVGEDLPKHFEQLWTRRVAADEFETCCIPFFLTTWPWATSCAAGQTVRAWSTASYAPRVAPSSARSSPAAARRSTMSPPASDRSGDLLERSSRHMSTIDARDQAHAQQVANRLAELEGAGRLRYETGRS